MDGEVFITSYVAPLTGQHFARRLWVPAHSHRMAWLPLRIPLTPSSQERQKITTLVLEGSGSREVFKRRQGDLLTSETIITVDHDSSKTITYFRTPEPNEFGLTPDLDGDAYLTTLLARKSAILNSTIQDFTTRILPPWNEVLDDIDVFVLTADRIVFDSSGIAMLRAWVRAGGRLWIMLDRVNPSTVSAILGNGVHLDIVDRVELDSFTLETLSPIKSEPVREEIEFETPVEMLRVATSSEDIGTVINGWPASIWLPYGQGEVLITTLDPRGWRAEIGESATNALKLLSNRLFNNRVERVSAAGLNPSLQEQIGYRIPPKAVALAVLGGYSLCLVGFGFVLHRKQRLDWLAWLVPLLTLGTTAGLFGFGTSNTKSVPPTIAYSQLLRVAPESGEVRIDGTAAIYDQESRELAIQSKGLNWVLPQAGDQAEVTRWIWTDDDGLEMQNEKSLAGSVRAAQLQGVTSLGAGNLAVAEFGPDGLVGKLTAPSLRHPTDPVLCATPAPSSSVQLESDGTFRVRPQDVLATDQYSAAALLSDEQRRRQNVMRALLNTTDTLHFPKLPTLLFWCEPYEGLVDYPSDFKIAGSALAALPIDLRRTPQKTKFQIPSTFLKPEIVVGKRGASTAYDPRTGKWVRGLTIASETTLRFPIPSQVRPSKLTSATLSVRLNAPSRKATIYSFRGTERLEVESKANPNGVWDVSFSAEQLQLDERGGLTLALGISETEKQQNSPPFGTSPAAPSETDGLPEFDNSTWQVDYVRLTVSGETP